MKLLIVALFFVTRLAAMKETDQQERAFINTLLPHVDHITGVIISAYGCNLLLLHEDGNTIVKEKIKDYFLKKKNGLTINDQTYILFAPGCKYGNHSNYFYGNLYHQTQKVGSIVGQEMEFSNCKIATINRLLIKADNQKKGLGSKLLHFTMQQLRTAGFKRMFVPVAPLDQNGKELFPTNEDHYQKLYKFFDKCGLKRTEGLYGTEMEITLLSET